MSRGPRFSAALGNVGLRLASQALRFALSFYVVGFLGLHAAGIYGLVLGAVGIVPALIGWGLNYHLSREIAGRSPAAAAPLVRDRIAVSLASLAGFSLLAVAAGTVAASAGDWPLLALALVLVWFETISLDVFVAMLAVGKPLLANLLVFIRSAAWVPPAVILGLAEPRLRTLEVLFLLWIAFHVVALAILALKLRRWDVGEGLRAPRDKGWAQRWFRRRWFIYLSDLAYVGLVYLDRYLVLVFLGLTATAVFTFYWGLANALQTIVLAALVQTGRPRLIILAGEGDNRGWQAELRRQLALALALALAMAAANFGLTETVIRLLPPGQIPADRTLFALLLGAVVLRCCSDVVNSGLISRGRDHAYAAANLLGVAATLAAVPLAAAAWGLTGAALALVLVAALLLVLRTSLLLARRGCSGAAGGGAIIANSIP